MLRFGDKVDDTAGQCRAGTGWVSVPAGCAMLFHTDNRVKIETLQDRNAREKKLFWVSESLSWPKFRPVWCHSNLKLVTTWKVERWSKISKILKKVSVWQNSLAKHATLDHVLTVKFSTQGIPFEKSVNFEASEIFYVLTMKLPFWPSDLIFYYSFAIWGSKR